MNVALRIKFNYFPVPIKLINDMEISVGILFKWVLMGAPHSYPLFTIVVAADSPFSFSDSSLESCLSWTPKEGCTQINEKVCGNHQLNGPQPWLCLSTPTRPHSPWQIWKLPTWHIPPRFKSISYIWWNFSGKNVWYKLQNEAKISSPPPDFSFIIYMYLI